MSAAAEAFIVRWRDSGAAERANYQLFFSELCDLLEVPRPDPTRPDDTANAYVFERAVTFRWPDGTTSTGRIDCYRRDCFVSEGKQGAEKSASHDVPLSTDTRERLKAQKRGTATRGTAGWDEAMLRAFGQAEQYARALPSGEGRPPLLLIIDVGHTIEIYSEFTRTGGAYVPFPDARSHRIPLERLADPAVRDLLRLAWLDPLALDPTRRSARVTREIAQNLGRLAQSLEKSGHDPVRVAAFLMRALFTMFAEDVELLPKDSLTRLLESLRGHPEQFGPMIEELWGRMKTGGFSTVLREQILRFNGALFDDTSALPLNDDQLALFIEASRADWRDVEPAIFGTLLERALDPHERHKLGAHYTPRAYVERLIFPVIIEPLRAEWDAVKAAALTLERQEKSAEAADVIHAFHRRLCELRILDPACGTGNFLYVTLDHLKRLEAEVLDTLERVGVEPSAALDLAGFTVDPHQFLGLEVNPRAAAIAELVLWIGHLQWHFRTHGRVAPPEPIVKAFHNIECRDAVLAWNAITPVLDDQGAPVTRWDGRTKKKHPVTGEDVPDDTATVPVVRYDKPRPAEWPPADFIVGNPPFLGPARMREALGDGYAEALRSVYPDVPDSADFVMFWWHKAAEQVRAGHVPRFGFITTNSLRQTFNRRVLENHLAHGVALDFAIPDHPWVDSADGAAVRIAMTVASAGSHEGKLVSVTDEHTAEHGEVEVALTQTRGLIHPDLTIGANVSGAVELAAMKDLSSEGMKPHGMGFLVTRDEAIGLGLGRVDGLEDHVRSYLNGRDLTATRRDILIIDLFGLSIEEVQRRFPEVYQWVLHRVKPERDQNNRAVYRDTWWIFGEPRRNFRPALAPLSRYIVTVKTSKHRFFTFLDRSVLPDSKLIAFAFDDAYHLGVLSSRVHVEWALAAGSHLGVGNDPTYVKSASFEKFPFPEPTDAQRTRIRELGEALDAHRKRQQAQHAKLTMTDMYNVLAKLRSGEALTAKEQAIHEQGLVSVLRQIHDDLDDAVAEAYGLPAEASDDTILAHLVALNAQRAAEESRGNIRYLRPEYQNPAAVPAQVTAELDVVPVAVRSTPAAKSALPWPKTLAEQARLVRQLLAQQTAPVTAEDLAKQCKGARSKTVGELLSTLASLGHAREVSEGQYLAA
jgi:hypothetical protein